MPAKMWCRDECSSKILGFFEDLWLALVRKYKFPDEWVFFFGGSLSLFTTNCRKAGHTTYNTLLLFLLLLFLLAAFSLSETWKKIIVGWQNDCSTWKFGMEKDTLSIPFNIQCSKAGKKWHLEREVLSTLEVNNFLGSSPLFFCWRGTILLNIIRQFLIVPFYSFLVGEWKFFFYWNGSKGIFRNNKKISKVKRWF